MTEETPEQILHDYVEAYRRTQGADYYGHTSVLTKYKIKEADGALMLSCHASPNSWNKDLAAYVARLATHLKDDLGFSLISGTDPKLSVTRASFFSSETYGAPTIHIDLRDKGFSQALEKLKQETIERQAMFNATIAREEEQSVAKAIERFSHALPNTPHTAVAAATIAMEQKMVHTLLDKKLLKETDVPETLALGKHTQAEADRLLHQSDISLK